MHGLERRVVCGLALLLALGALAGCAQFSGWFRDAPEGVAASFEGSYAWEMLGVERGKQPQACGAALGAQAAKAKAQELLSRMREAQQLQALLGARGKPLKLGKAAACRVKRDQPKRGRGVALQDGGPTGEEEIGTLVEIPAGSDAALYLAEVYDEGESWASIKEVDPEGERLVQIETLVPEDYDLEPEGELSVGEVPWFLPGETGSGELIAEVLEGLAEAGPEGWVFRPAALAEADPAYLAFAQEASDPELDWSQADAIVDEESEELVLFVPSAGAVAAGEALWGSRLSFLDDGHSLAVRAPVRRVTRPATNTQRWTVQRNTTTQRPTIRSTIRTRHLPQPFGLCPYQHYGRLSRAKKALCNTWEQRHQPKVNRVKFKSAKKNVRETSQKTVQTLNANASVIGLSGKNANLVLAGFKDVSQERIDKFYQEAARAAASGANQTNGLLRFPFIADNDRLPDDRLSPPEDTISTAVNATCSFASDLIGQITRVGENTIDAICFILGEMNGWREVQSVQEQADLREGINRIASQAFGVEVFTLGDIEKRILGIENAGLSSDERQQVNSFLGQLEQLLQQQMGTESLEASKVLATALFGLRQAFRASHTEADAIGNGQLFVKSMIDEMGPELFLMIHFMQQATSELTWNINADWERHIPVQDFATLGKFLDMLKSKDIINTDNAVKLITFVGVFSQLALENGMTFEVKEALARAGFLAELAVEAQVAGYNTAQQFEVLTEIGGESVDFKFQSLKLRIEDKTTFITGIVVPFLKDGVAVKGLIERIKKVDKALEGSAGNAPQLIVVVVQQASEANVNELCADVRSGRTFAFVVVIVNGRVALNGTCHSIDSSVNDKLLGSGRDGGDVAQGVCDLEVTLCGGETDTSSSGGGGASAPPVIVSLPLPPEVLCPGGGACLTPEGKRLWLGD